MKYGDALRDHPNAQAILKLYKARLEDDIPHPVFEPDPYDRLFERPVDLCEYFRRSEEGLHLEFWWNYYE